MAGIRGVTLRMRGVLLLSVALLSACGSSDPVSGQVGPLPPLQDATLDGDLQPAMLQTSLRGCEFLDSAYCMYPWPNDYFTRPDNSTDTGKRINLNVLAMPKDLAGLPLRPDEWNRNDGFSPGQLILSYVPGLDTAKSGVTGVDDIEASLGRDAPIIIIDADTGERHPLWTEIDASETASTLCDLPTAVVHTAGLVAGELGLDGPLASLGGIIDGLGAGCTLTLEPILAALGSGLDATGLARNNALKIDPPALLIAPAKNFTDGHRYIVALRNLKNADGQTIEAPAGFRVYRDRYSSDIGAVNDRRAHMEDIIADLQRHGVARNSLYLAWDFTVASTRSTAGRLLAMRDTALEKLGDHAPAFQVLNVTNFADGASIRRVEGTFTVPNFLTIPDGLCDNLVPPVSNLVDYCAQLQTLGDLLGGTGIPGLGDLLGTAAGASDLLIELGQLPLSRLYYGLPGGELPQINPLQPTQDFHFQCEIPRTAVGSFDDANTWVRPALPTLYGHGLLGSKGEVGGGSTARLREENFMNCAIDWIGMASRDVPGVLTFLIDMSNFPTLPDRAQQGVVNWHYLTRLLNRPDGFASDPAFQTADGRPVFDNSKVVYDGNSQGGIMGGMVVATSTDITRGSLGVPGMNYSTLLRRSVDFDSYGALLYASYPNSFDQSFILSMIQMLWDRAETNGYATHLRDPSAFEALGHPTPKHEVILNGAFGDHQVADITPEVMSRSWDGAIHRPATEPGRRFGNTPYPLIRDAVNGQSDSVMVVWDDGPLNPDDEDNLGVDSPPATNRPNRSGRDPHSDPRAEVAGGIQRRHFLHNDKFVDVCGGRPCYARNYVGADVANGTAGNLAPFISNLGVIHARPGTQVAATTIAADPDRNPLTYAWTVAAGAECVTGIEQADQPVALINLAATCAAGEVRALVTVTDDKAASSSNEVVIKVE